MKANRISSMEESFKNLHGIKPVVMHEAISGETYKIHLQYKNKNITLQETLERGLTKKCDLTYKGVTREFKTVFEAEQEATKLLKE